MTDKPDNPPFEDLAAYADGEMEPADRMRVTRQMAGDPAMALQVMHQQALREVVGRSVRENTPEMPAELRAQIEQMVDVQSSPPAPAVPSQPSQAEPAVVGRIGFGRWMPAAVAAALLLATVIVFFARPQPILPGAMIDLATSRHNDCARMRAELDRWQEFPAQLAELPKAVEKITHAGSYPSLDLSKMGYKFWRAGHCMVPGKESVHLVYNVTGDERGKDDALSLWMIKNSKKFDHLEIGKMYRATSDGQSKPLIVWRDGDMVYFLMGDTTPKQVEAAAQYLHRSAL